MRSFRWSKWIFKKSTIFREIGLQVFNQDMTFDKKAIFFSKFFFGRLKRHLLRIPKWCFVGWNGTSNYLKIAKNQNFVLRKTVNVGFWPQNQFYMSYYSYHWIALWKSFPKWCIMIEVIGEHGLASMASRGYVKELMTYGTIFLRERST